MEEKAVSVLAARFGEAIHAAFITGAWHEPLQPSITGLTAQQANWKPAPARHSIAQNVYHVILWQEYAIRALRGEHPEPGAFARRDWPEDPVTEGEWNALLANLKKVDNDFRQVVAALDDEALLSAPGQNGESPFTMILSAIGHMSYHAGQIMYLKALQKPGA